MRFLPHRVILPALVLTWALSHAAVFGDDPKNEGKKDSRQQPAVERIRKALDQPITLDFSGDTIMAALQHVKDKTNLDFNIDQVAVALTGMNVDANNGEPVTIKSSGGKVQTALRKFLSAHQLAYVIYEDAILITTPELAVQRQMKQRVNLDVDEVPLAKALRDLARNYAFNLVIDPKLVKEAQKPVSLNLDGATLETSVRLLAELAGLKAVRMDNVLFVTSEERADKLRKEDKDAQPNPLDDPNMLGGPRGGVAAMLGNLGIAGPAIKAVPSPIKDVDEGVAPKPAPLPPPPPAVQAAPSAPALTPAAPKEKKE
jgi:type II secretory pathway component HofQ